MANGPVFRLSVSPSPNGPAPMPSLSPSNCWHDCRAWKDGLIPADVKVTVTRNYGETANDKANELLFHLALATVSIVVLIAFAIGWREALVTLVVIPTTILLTLFAAKLMGYTINRVSLFALIFSIGILVDDAIVVIENIARHWALKDGRPRQQGAVEAVAEVGNPTIVATLTVVAALLPMLFVSGLMGPYMAPIPANASAAMLFSFFVAMVIAPWLMLRLHPEGRPVHEHEAAHGEGILGRLYRRMAAPIVRSRRSAWIFLICGRGGDLARCAPVCNQERHGQAAAIRQQIGVGRGRRSARRRNAGRHRADAVLDRRRGAATARNPLDRNLCRHAGAVQFQRPGASLLYARTARTGRTAPQSGAARRASAQPVTPSRSICAPAEGDRLAGRHGRPGGRSAAGAAGAGDAARRSLWADLDEPARRRRVS